MRRRLAIALSTVLALAAIGVGGISVASAATAPPAKTVTIAEITCPGSQVYCYKAPALTVKPGTKVVWKNTSSVPHTVTRCKVATCKLNGGTGKDTNFGSKTINPGKTYTFTFHKAGTYRYFCTFHGYSVMHGMITVH